MHVVVDQLATLKADRNK